MDSYPLSFYWPNVNSLLFLIFNKFVNFGPDTDVKQLTSVCCVEQRQQICPHDVVTVIKWYFMPFERTHADMLNSTENPVSLKQYLLPTKSSLRIVKVVDFIFLVERYSSAEGKLAQVLVAPRDGVTSSIKNWQVVRSIYWTVDWNLTLVTGL